MKKAINIEKLTFQHSFQTELFADLSLNFQQGMIHGLLGNKGEGKSTLLKLISGILFPWEGSVSTLGFDPSKRKPVMLSNIYFLPEEMNPSNLSVKNFERVYAPFYSNFSSSEFYQYMHELLVDTSSQDISKLDDGHRRKFFIAFGLATNAKVILLDEPTADMDDNSKIQFRKTIAAAKRKNNCIILATSEVADMEDILDNIIILKRHKIVLNETREQIVARLIFSNDEQPDPNKLQIYSETSDQGVRRLYKNNTGESGPINIELLFNAATYEKNSTIDALDQ